MTDLDRGHLRSLIGASAAVWAAEGGVDVQADRWVALSGAAAVDYNVAVCHRRGATIAGRDAILAGGRPGLVMLAGEALGEAQMLVESGWACVDAVPVLSRSLVEVDDLPKGSGTAGECRRLGPAELGAARELIATAFDVSPDLGRVALPERALAAAGVAVWAAFDEVGEMASCLIAVQVEDAVVLWSMATDAGARGRGHGSRLLAKALDDAARSGSRLALLQSSPAQVGFYERLGFAECERWQVWSRPRWVLGRA